MTFELSQIVGLRHVQIVDVDASINEDSVTTAQHRVALQTLRVLGLLVIYAPRALGAVEAVQVHSFVAVRTESTLLVLVLASDVIVG